MTMYSKPSHRNEKRSKKENQRKAIKESNINKYFACLLLFHKLELKYTVTLPAIR